MKDDSKLFSILALLMIVGAGVAVYFVYFNQPAPSETKPGNTPENPKGTPNVRPGVTARDFAPETAGRGDPVVSKKPDQPVTLDKALRRMLISGHVTDEAGGIVADIRVEFQGLGDLAMFRGTGYTDPAGNYSLLAWERSNMRHAPGNEDGGWVYAKAPDGRMAAGEIQKFALGPSAVMADILLKAQAGIEGVVVDSSGGPAPFAQVALRSVGVVRIVEETGGAATYEHRPLTRTATADERGQYSFTKLPPGKYGLTVDGGYFGVAQNHTDVDASDGTLHWQELKLTRLGYVRGTLKDQDGVPIEGAVVMLRQVGVLKDADGKIINPSTDDMRSRISSNRDGKRGSDFRANAARWRNVTDAEGRFGFANIYDVELALNAQLGAKTAELTDVRVNQGDYSLTLALECSVAGTVRDAATNSPVTRYDVRIFGGDAEPTPFDSVNADAVFPWHSAGRYRILNAPAGTIALRVCAPGYAPAVINVRDLATGERRQSMDLALKPLCDLTLTLKVGEKLLPREPVFLLYDGRSIAEASTDDFGEVRLPALMAADYEIRVQRADGSVLTAKVTVPAQPTSAATVVLGPK